MPGYTGSFDFHRNYFLLNPYVCTFTSDSQTSHISITKINKNLSKHKKVLKKKELYYPLPTSRCLCSPILTCKDKNAPVQISSVLPREIVKLLSSMLHWWSLPCTQLQGPHLCCSCVSWCALSPCSWTSLTNMTSSLPD